MEFLIVAFVIVVGLIAWAKEDAVKMVLAGVWMLMGLYVAGVVVWAAGMWLLRLLK